MVQILSINFFSLDFFNFRWDFQKFPFFCVILYLEVHKSKTGNLRVKVRANIFAA